MAEGHDQETGGEDKEISELVSFDDAGGAYL